jgi:hypothetical protein
MADDLSDEVRRQLGAQEAARGQRDDAFSRLLGDEWAEVEPGIYRKKTRPASSAGSRKEPGGPSVDQALVDALSLLGAPTDDETPNQPVESAPRRNV